jgi:hypothetical protein
LIYYIFKKNEKSSGCRYNSTNLCHTSGSSDQRPVAPAIESNVISIIYTTTGTHAEVITLSSDEDEDLEEEHYHIDKILDHKVLKTCRRFLILWKNTDEKTWEPDRNLATAPDTLK